MEEVEQAIRDVQHFGEEGGVVPVIDVAATSTFLDPADMESVFHGTLPGRYLYSRHANPTVTAFGKKLAAMEGMEAALGVSSGMAASPAPCSRSFLRGARRLLPHHLRRHVRPVREHISRGGIRVTFVDPDDVSAFERAVEPDTKVVFTETMSNPLLGISDLKSLGRLAKERGALLVVDNTFTPALVTPSRFGADVVVYSCTKYISGSSDLIAGAIVGREKFIEELVDINRGVVMLTGPVMDPKIAHLLYLRLDHLPIRMAAHSRDAGHLAARMEEAGLPVIYPGLKSHPQHDLMKRMMHPEYGYGGMLTVDCGTRQKAFDLAARLQGEKFGLYAVSLGFSRTLMSCPAVSTSSEIPPGEHEKMHLSPGLLRLSIGYTGSPKVMWERFHRCWKEIF
jgi:methionine-gamma-lyase